MTPEYDVSVWINCLGTTLSPIILSALIAHHTPSVSLCDGTSWINMGNLLFWESTVPGFKKKNSSTTKQATVYRAPGKVPVKKRESLCLMVEASDHGCLTHKTYTCHTVQNTYSASMAVSDSQSVFRFNLCCLSYSALFRFLSRIRCTSMGVWGCMIY
jgi:hypothetical protein